MVRITVLIVERELFIFHASLYKGTLCSGIVGLSSGVSWEIRVYSEGFLPAVYPEVYTFPTLKVLTVRTSRESHIVENMRNHEPWAMRVSTMSSMCTVEQRMINTRAVLHA